MTVGWNGTFPVRSGIVLIALLVGVPGAAAADDPWRFWWDNGFKLESPEGDFKLRFGGRLQADWTFADADQQLEGFVGPVVDGNEFRRARLFVSGIVYKNVEFKAEYDFAGGDAEFKDVYVGIRDTPIGNLRVGHFKEPFSLEMLTSGKFITFLERSLPNAFAPDRNTGFMVHDHVGDRFTWAVGAFQESDDFGTADNTEGKLNITARATGLPIYRDAGRHLLHLGLSFTQKDLGSDLFRFEQPPEANQAQPFVETIDFMAEDFNIYDAELAWVAARFWLAAEHMVAEGDSASVGDPTFEGTYVQAGVFLTDDRRRYETSSGAFGRTRPNKNFGEGGGAWELAVRFSTLDLTDGPISGGELEDFSIAVNWYLNPATRLMVNYINADREDLAEGEADFFLVRFHVDF